MLLPDIPGQQRSNLSHSMWVTAGAVVTPGNNTYGTYVQLLSGAAVTEDAHGIWVHVNTMSVSGSARNALAKVGFDLAGGTTYTDKIVDLVITGAGAVAGTGCGGLWFYFPLFIKAGTSIALAASVDSATVGTCNATCRLVSCAACRVPPRTGAFVRTFGAVPASSSGTAVTPGSAAKGTYVQVGTTAENLWFWQIGLGINNTVYNNNSIFVDLAVGDATTKRIIVADQLLVPTVGETLSMIAFGTPDDVPSGTDVFIRVAVPGSPAAGFYVAGYGIGG